MALGPDITGNHGGHWVLPPPSNSLYWGPIKGYIITSIQLSITGMEAMMMGL